MKSSERNIGQLASRLRPLAGTGLRCAAAPAAELIGPVVVAARELVRVTAIHPPLEGAVATALKFPTATCILPAVTQAATDVDDAGAIREAPADRISALGDRTGIGTLTKEHSPTSGPGESVGEGRCFCRRFCGHRRWRLGGGGQTKFTEICAI